jgi:hypothetical protein
MVARVVVLVALAGCGPKAVAEPARAPGPRPSIEPTLVFLPGTGPVAVGTPIYASVAWDSNCLYGERLCYQMAQVVDVLCDADACSGHGSGHAFDVTPTKAGSLRGTATLRATQGTYRKVFPLAIEAAVPDRANATCARLDGVVLLTLELAHGGRRVRAVPPKLFANDQACEHEATISIGWPEPPSDSFRYACRTEAAKLELVIEAPAYKLSSRCQM